MSVTHRRSHCGALCSFLRRINLVVVLICGGVVGELGDRAATLAWSDGNESEAAAGLLENVANMVCMKTPSVMICLCSSLNKS